MKISIKNKSFTMFIKNFSTLFFGHFSSSLFSILSTFLLVSYIGIIEYGKLVLGLTFVNVINLLFNIQSFNSVIKFGSDSIVNKNGKLEFYIKQGIVQDSIAAVISFTFSLIFTFLIWDLISLNDDIKTIFFILSFSSIFNMSGSFIGVLRLYGQFKKIAFILNFVSILKLLAFIISINLKFDSLLFVIIELISLIFLNVLNIFFGLVTLRNNKIILFNNYKLQFDKDFFLFNLYNHFVKVVDLPVSEITKIIINQTLGFSDLGVFSIMQKVGSILLKTSDVFSVTIFPEFSRLVSQKKVNKVFEISKKIVIFSFILSFFILASYALSFNLFSSIFIDFKDYFQATFFYFLFILFSASTVAIHQLFISLNLIKYNLLIISFSNVLYVTILIVLLNYFNLGLIGFIFSLILQALLVILLKILVLKKSKKLINIPV